MLTFAQAIPAKEKQTDERGFKKKAINPSSANGTPKISPT